MKRIRFTDVDNLYFNEKRHGVEKDGKIITLPDLPYKLLQVLVNNQDKWMSSAEIADAVWPGEGRGYEDVNVLKFRLRKELKKITNKEIIQSEKGGTFVNIEIEEIPDSVKKESIVKAVYDADGNKQCNIVSKLEEFLIDEQKQHLYIPLINAYYRKYRNLSLEKFTQKNHGLSEDIRLAEAYGFPRLEPICGNERPWGLNESAERGRYLVQAPAGFGKSTLVKSILLSIISQDIEELNKVIEKDNLTKRELLREERKEKEIVTYKQLRKFHNIQKEYFPIMLEAVKMNFENLTVNSSEEDIFEFLYESGGFSGYFNNGNLDDEGKVINTKAQWRALLEDCNRKKQLLFLVDGYDEIPIAQRVQCGVFLDKLGTSSFGSKATIIVTSRPMESGDSLAGYSSYEIVATDINRDEEFVIELIKKYVHFLPMEVDVVELVEKMKANEFLRKLLISPYMIVLVALSMLENSVYGGKEYLIRTNRVVNDLIESLATRHRDIYEDMQNNPKEMRPLLEMFEAFAYEMLCNVTREGLGILDLNNRFVKTAMETAQSVRERYAKLYPYTEFMYLKNSNAEIADLLFTGLGLMEKTEGKISFVAPEVITVELGARWLLRSLVRAENTGYKDSYADESLQQDKNQSEALEQFFIDAERMDKYYRYTVLVVVITWLSDSKNMKGLETWKLNVYDMSMDCEDILLKIIEYLIEDCVPDKEEVEQAIKSLLSETYGSNLLINCKDKDYREKMQRARERIQEFVGEV